MTVRTEELRNGQRIEVPPPRPSAPSIWQFLAVVIWALACLTTWQLVVAVTEGMAVIYQITIGVALQAMFTALERPVLRGRPNKISVVALGFDTLVNAGGIFPFAMRMSTTPTAQMLSTTFHLSPQMTPPAAFAVSIVLGFLLAAAPEAVWRWRG